MFSFLNAFLLYGLVLASIPILIHLLNRKKARVVPFSSNRFLKALQKKQIKKLRWQQILLLIIRAMIVACLVIAFGRPVWKWSATNGNINAHAKTSVVLILDNSLSASSVNQRGQALERIKNKAMEVISHLQEGDEFVIIDASGLKKASNLNWSSNFSEARARLKNIVIENYSFAIDKALHESVSLLAQAKNPNREIYIISDLQKSDRFNTQIPDYGHIKPHLVVIAIDGKPESDLAILKTETENRFFQKNRPIEMVCTIRNSLSTQSGERILHVYANGKRVGQSVLQVDAKTDNDVRISFPASESGFVSGYAELDDDGFLANNRYYFHYYVPSDIKVLVAGELADKEFIELALKAHDQQAGNIITKSVLFDKLATVDLKKFDVLILVNPGRWDESQTNRVVEFLKEGGGILMIPGTKTDITQFNKQIADRLDVSRLIQMVSLNSENHSFIELQFDAQPHPLIADIFTDRTSLKNIESPKFYRYFNTDSRQGQNILTFGKSGNFLTEYAIYNGHFMLMTSMPVMTWNDLPIRAFFVPLMHRCLYALYGKENDKNQFVVGDAVKVRIQRDANDMVRMRSLTGEQSDYIPSLVVQNNIKIAQIDKLDMAGNYSLVDKNDSRVLTLVSANIPNQESEFATWESDSLKIFSGIENITFLTEKESIEHYILQSRFGIESWKWFIAFAIILMLFELTLGQIHRLQRNTNK